MLSTLVSQQGGCNLSVNMASPKTSQILDNLYGTCRVPGPVDTCERLLRPGSWFKLDEAGAQALKELSGLARGDFYLSHCLYSEFTVLWLIDRHGDLLIALEEALSDFDQNNPEVAKKYPLPRFLPWRALGIPRLGHPALVLGGEGRIGGELDYKSEPGGGKWYLSNKSGRFGIGSDRSQEHLEHVAKIFRRHGIDVTTYFLR